LKEKNCWERHLMNEPIYSSDEPAMGPKEMQTARKGKAAAQLDTVFDFSEADKKSAKPAAKKSGVASSSGSDSQNASKYTTDKLGNTVLKSKLAEDAATEAMRAAAKARRAEKEAALAQPASAEAPAATVSEGPSHDASDNASGIEELRSKAAAGQKLTHKEKKTLSAHEKALAEDADRIAQASAELQSFSLSAPTQSSVSAGCVDIIAENVSISAPSRPLLAGATIRLVSGHRYGLLGPNGRY
jgi:hypothetical protein